jgi:hypothetical protein
VTATRFTGGAARAVALLTLGALAVHELRYLVAYGADADAALASQGHAYLSELGGMAAGLGLALLLGSALGRARLPRSRTGGRSALGSTAALYGAAIVAIFCAQESAEGALFAGHAAGLAAPVANGGWIALPLALVAGLLCALAARALERVDDALAAPPRSRVTLPRPSAVAAPNPAPPRIALGCLALAFGLARRPPPLPSTV